VSLDRRTLFRAGGVAAVAGAIPMTMTRTTAVAAPGRSPALTTRNPLVEQRADPFITRPSTACTT
jgi:hypothetical protein